MELTEQTTVPGSALPVDAFRDHLRLGTGFADDTTLDVLLEQYLRAAMTTIEARIAKVLLARMFRLRLTRWRDGLAQPLPLAPVREVTQVVVIDRDGAETEIDPARWRLEPDAHRPRLVATGYLLPGVPTGGAVQIVFDAGFGDGWSDLPPDLAQAVFLLAAQFYEQRAGDAAGGQALPLTVSGLVERWRTVRSMGAGTGRGSA